MAKPRLIILIRHAQSEGNKNRDIHQTTPDHRVKLTQDGWSQAHEAGRRLRQLLRPDDTLHFFTSPYRRTRETTDGILTTLTSDDPEPSPFRRNNIKVYEEPRLREQDFGNFQPCSAEMERMWQERADYGHFFYRIANGESAADAYDRVSGFNESLWRQFGEDDFASVCVLVTHGLMSRVFLMKWYHFSVEYFEDLRNINHCEFLIMRKKDSGKYLLENKLRTWSELRRERALAAAKDKDKNKDKDKDKDAAKLEQAKSPVAIRRWGGCPDGCNHTTHYKKRGDLDAMRQKDQERASSSATSINGSSSSKKQRPQPASPSSNAIDSPDNSAEAKPTPGIDIIQPDASTEGHPPPSSASSNNGLRRIKSPHLHVGRDFGGTYSGHASVANSDTEASEDETARKHRFASLNARLKATVANIKPKSRNDKNGSHEDDDNDGDADEDEDLEAATTADKFLSRNKDDDTDDSHVGAYANRLGDAPPNGDSGSDEDEERTDEVVEEDHHHDHDDDMPVDKEERSVQGSVF